MSLIVWYLFIVVASCPAYEFLVAFWRTMAVFLAFGGDFFLFALSHSYSMW